MELICLGLNHRSAPVEVRERLSVAEGKTGALATQLSGLPDVSEAVVLSTCNRFEIYAGVEDGGLDQLVDFVRRRAEDPAVPLYQHHGDDAARHLYAVAGGLDSMVLGETEIFGQVKTAYAAAHGAGTTGRLLNKLFQYAFQAGKQIRTKTRIQQGSTSIGAVAVDLAEKIFGRLDACAVMLIGAGEMSRTTAQSLTSRGARSIFVSNRSFDRATELAAEIDGEAVRFDDWEARAAQVDIIICSTSAPHPLLSAGAVREAMSARPGRPLFVIDIAVPRDVEPGVNEVEGVYLYDIDHLEQIAAAARGEREKQIAACEGIIDALLQKAPPSSFLPGSSPDAMGRGDEGSAPAPAR